MLGRIRSGAIFLAAFSLRGQDADVRIYSEFQRVTPFGTIVASDRAAAPREVISPAVVRNGYASFHVAVTAPPNAIYFLAVQMYPSNILRVKLYRETFTGYRGEWIPDALEEIRTPSNSIGVMPDPWVNVPGQTTNVYLLDVWVPPETPPGFVRLEVLAKTIDWRVAPMELRIQPARVPSLPVTLRAPPVPALGAPADEAAWSGVLMDSPSVPPAPLNVRSVIWRNAAQDAAVWRELAPGAVQELRRGLWEALSERESFGFLSPGAELYLRFRNQLIRAASRHALR